MRSTMIVALAWGAGFAMAPASAQDYAVLQVPNLPGWPSMLPNDLNDRGEATGIGFLSFAWLTRAFYYDGENVHDFTADLIDATPHPFVGSRGLCINNRGHILFNLEIVDVGVFSYIWDGESHNEIAPTVPSGAAANGSWMNDHGLVGGGYRQIIGGNLIQRGFVWDMIADETTIIEPPPPFTDSGVAHVSNTGWATGFVSGGPGPARGFLWKDGVFTLMEPFDKDDYLSISSRVNDAGMGAGFTTNFPEPGQPSTSRAVLWSIAGVHDWSYPVGGLTGFDVRGLNNANEVVGTMYGPQQPFHWKDSVMRNLNNHITSPQPGVTLDLWEAAAVNQSGQIIAHGQYIGTGDFANYCFVLTPVTPPILGDLNGDGSVNVQDLLILLGAWGPCPPLEKGECPADLNDSGAVDVQDLLILLANWG